MKDKRWKLSNYKNTVTLYRWLIEIAIFISILRGMNVFRDSMCDRGQFRDQIARYVLSVFNCSCNLENEVNLFN